MARNSGQTEVRFCSGKVMTQTATRPSENTDLSQVSYSLEQVIHRGQE